MSGPLATDPPPSRGRAWLHALRIHTLSASAVPVLVGTSLAWRHGGLRPLAAFAALIGALGIQIGTNLANDLFDHGKGADPPERIGPPRVLSVGWLSAPEVRAGMLASFAVAVLAGLYLFSVAGWPVVTIGLSSIAAGILYTAGPVALAYIGLGDVFVFLFFGFVAVVGTYYVETLRLDPEAIIVALPVGALATSILVVNNLRDVETDRAARKFTLAVVLGRRAARAEYAALLASAYLVPLALWAQGLRSAWVLLPLATTSLAARLFQSLFAQEGGPSLNQTLVGTAQLHALFGLLFAAGIALG